MQFYSHPDKLLIDHLKEVRDIGIGKLPRELRDAYEIASLSHDFGKYTSYFQKYLKNNNRSEYSNHGFISAIFGAYLAFEIYGEENYLPLLIYNAILHHHGNLESPSFNLPHRYKNIKRTDFEFNLLKKIDIFKIQIDDVRQNRSIIEEDMELLGWKKYFASFIEQDDLIYEILSKLKKIDRGLSKDDDYKPYFIHQAIYSALISSDKLSASGIEYDKPLFESFNKLNKIKNQVIKKDGKKINDIRNEIFEKVQTSLENKHKDNNIFFITAPTGTGKTYTGFYAALRLKELLNMKGKIIYVLPFTSIIEQNFDSLVNIYEKIDDFNKNRSRYIIKHHNLSKTDYETEYRDYTKTQSELLVENWESGVIITTFVQLFETIIGSRNRMLKKYVNFYDSVILLDEIQSVDIKYYKLIEFTLEKLCELTNSKIIMMTATKPMLLTDGVELLDDNEKYYNLFNRTKLIPKLESRSIDEFVDEFLENMEDKSYLIVCNTINQSLEIFDKLKDLDREVYYLSTNILPIHRSERIEKIREKLNRGEKIILVSTQVVEAGVDLDFDEVIRDIGPLDSIIQCAGRCNRNGNKDIGSVKIYRMVNEHGYNYANYIYGNTTIDITMKLIRDKDVISERSFYYLIEEYFKEVIENKSKNESEDFIKAINSLDFSKGDKSINKFSLIKNNPMYHDVLFVYDDIVEESLEEYKAISKIRNFEEKREKYLEIGQVFKNYTLSLPEKYCKYFTEEAGLLILPRVAIEDYYDENIGFIRDKEDETLIFWGGYVGRDKSKWNPNLVLSYL